MAKNTIHRSISTVNSARKGRFLAWAENHPEAAWEQAVEERGEARPWKIWALRSHEGEAAAAAIKTAYLAALTEAQKVSATALAGPARLAAQARLRVARKRYTEVEAALKPQRHRR